MPNQLASSRSSYLRSAAHQPIDWHPWSEAAFERAQRESKPVLLDIGAVWCHWCHVMDGESYEDPELARLINERFVPVKVDRDERPDVDARYQKVVSALTGQGGWPLTAFLTGDGRAFYGGTYYPPRPAHGRPSFRQVLEAVADAYSKDHEKLVAQAAHLEEHVSAATRTDGAGENIDAEWIEAAVSKLEEGFDILHGGWGRAPKFPHPSAVECLLSSIERNPNKEREKIVRETLTAMARGGIRDHVGGGFHRYSVDAEWHVPHFEKMLYDNAELLRNYVHAWRIFRDPVYRAVADETAAFLSTTLRDPAGGYRGSQDADVTFGDDGDYYTWTLQEIQDAVRDARTAKLLSLRYGVEPRGPMHHNAEKNVLHIDADVDELASALETDEAEIRTRLADGLQRLRGARAARKTPFVDPVLYANWNGMAIRAALEYAGVMGDEGRRAEALRSLDRFLKEAYDPKQGFAHTIGGQAVTGLLDDQAQMLPALCVAFAHTGKTVYIERAREVADLLLREFWDEDVRGFTDTARTARGAVEARPLERPERPLQDSPSHSANARAIEGLLMLYEATGDPKYEKAAAKALACVSSETRAYGLFAAALAYDALRWSQPPAKVVVAGKGSEPLHAAALAELPVGGVVLRADGGDLRGLPAEAVAFARGPARERAAALVCIGQTCLPPVSDASALRAQLRGKLPKPNPA